METRGRKCTAARSTNANESTSIMHVLRIICLCYNITNYTSSKCSFYTEHGDAADIVCRINTLGWYQVYNILLFRVVSLKPNRSYFFLLKYTNCSIQYSRRVIKQSLYPSQALMLQLRTCVMCVSHSLPILVVKQERGV